MINQGEVIVYINKKGVQFSRKDTFNLDSTLSPIILSGLKRFKEVLIEQKEQEGGVYGVPCKEGSMEGLEPDEWFDILDKIIYAFDLQEEPDSKNYDFEIQFGSKAPITEDDKKEWDRYVADCRKHEQKVQEGLELFSYWYQSLWW